MRFIGNLLVRSGARDDARLHVNSIEDRVTSKLGLRPRLDPVGNAEHASYVATLAEKHLIAELRDDIARDEDLLTNYTSSWILTIGVVAAILIELLGANLVLKAIGIDDGERLPLALALALALVGITATLAGRTGAREGVANEGVVKRSLWTIVILAAYSLFVGAITIVRIRAASEEDASQVEIVAQAALMLATSLGPPWIAEWLMRRRGPALRLRKQLRVLKTRLKKAEKAHARAEGEVHRLAREGARWDVDAARERATYTTQHRLEAERERQRVALEETKRTKNQEESKENQS